MHPRISNLRRGKKWLLSSFFPLFFFYISYSLRIPYQVRDRPRSRLLFCRSLFFLVIYFEGCYFAHPTHSTVATRVEGTKHFDIRTIQPQLTRDQVGIGIGERWEGRFRPMDSTADQMTRTDLTFDFALPIRHFYPCPLILTFFNFFTFFKINFASNLVFPCRAGHKI